MKPDIDSLIDLWREQNELSEKRLEEIRFGARGDSTQSAYWWKKVLKIPRSVFLGKVA